jgi:hypothetical protein
MEGSQQCIADFKKELLIRRDMFYKGLEEAAPGCVFGHAARRRVLRLREDQWRLGEERRHHRSVIVVGDGGIPDQARPIGCVPGVDFGAGCEGYIRFCTCRSREELTGALASMKETLSRVPAR